MFLVLFHRPLCRTYGAAGVDQDKFWILDNTPYYMREAVRLAQDSVEITEVSRRFCPLLAITSALQGCWSEDWLKFDGGPLFFIFNFPVVTRRMRKDMNTRYEAGALAYGR